MKKPYILLSIFGFCLIYIVIFQMAILDNWSVIKNVLSATENSQAYLNRIALEKKKSVLLHWTNLMQSDLNVFITTKGTN